MNGGCSKVLFWASEESIVLEEGRMSKVSCSTETQAVSYPSGRLLKQFLWWLVPDMDHQPLYTESTHVGTTGSAHSTCVKTVQFEEEAGYVKTLSKYSV